MFQGVNYFLANFHSSYPVEFKLVKLSTVAPWTEDDLLAFQRFMAWSMNYGWSGKMARARMVAELAAKRFNGTWGILRETNIGDTSSALC